MKRKNLEKAIIMGLMAASISVPVWAADYVKTNEEIGQGTNLSEYDNIILNYDSNFNGTSPIWVGKVTIDANNKFSIVNTKQDQTKGKGINLYGAGVDIKAKNIVINTYDDGIFTTNRNPDGPNLNPGEDTNVSIHDFETLNITSEIGFGIVNNGNPSKDGSVLGNIYITADPNTDKRTSISISGGYLASYNPKSAIKNAKANTETVLKADDINLTGVSYGTWASSGKIELDAYNNIISAKLGNYYKDIYKSYGIGIYNSSSTAQTIVNAKNENRIHGDKEAVKATGGTVSISGKNNYLDASYDESLIADADKNKVAEVNRFAVNSTGSSNIEVNAQENNIITSVQYGVNAENNAQVKIIGKNNIIEAAKDEKGYGSSYAIKVDTKSNNWFKYNGADTVLNAINGNNELYGAIYAKGDGSSVLLDHFTGSNENRVNAKGSNYIISSAHGTENEHVVAAMYAKDNATIDIKAGEDGVNYVVTDFNFEHDDDSERTIWAQQGGKINIEGQTYIFASNSGEYTEGQKGNARGIAITAGTGIITDSDGNVLDEFKDPETGALAYIKDADRSTVNLDYKNSGDGILHSFIKGDLVSGYGGLIQVNSVKDSGLDMMGNALAANGGILELDLGNGGTWYGRADDYGDAGYGNDAKNHENFYNPAFSNEIIEGGTVNITMGEGSKWYLTGQSWVSSLDISEANGNAVINMAYDGDTHGLTIGSLNGTADGKSDATFIMALNHDNHEESDMLYVKNATGEYDVVINDMIDGIENINENNVLRFATVKGGATFENVTMKDTGIYNLEFEVDHSEYNENDTKENSGYNGEGIDTNKPGNSNVEDFFRDENDENSKNNIMLLDENLKEDPDSVQNWYITSVKGQDISDGGKTVVNMSKVNYSNAVYMDRLNKRLGEARYINTEEDQGMWVRMRHDRIGKDNEFRIMNTMYELGYDEKQECDNGERRVGAAIDYMDGSSEYTGVGGSGDVSRKGIWLYDTWLGDKGHYSDFVAKWGHLSNDFTLYRGGDKITGDFSNNVYSISAEYGRKKDIGNNWYFEPQVQLQYARVTDANYTTSQGTEVSLDAINSLIARAGFRLGKDLGERSTVYFKADLLHEFLGDQDIYATDGTGTMDVTYGNEGTWCDIGFGFATAMSKTSYAYLDVETSLGNGYEETYQINAGLQWSF